MNAPRRDIIRSPRSGGASALRVSNPRNSMRHPPRHGKETHPVLPAIRSSPAPRAQTKATGRIVPVPTHNPRHIRWGRGVRLSPPPFPAGTAINPPTPNSGQPQGLLTWPSGWVGSARTREQGQSSVSQVPACNVSSQDQPERPRRCPVSEAPQAS